MRRIVRRLRRPLNPKDKNYKYGADLSGADLTDAYLVNVKGLNEAKKTGIRGLPK